jgi:hypothetical protein
MSFPKRFAVRCSSAETVLGKTGAVSLRDRPITELSGGEWSRIVLAWAHSLCSWGYPGLEGPFHRARRPLVRPGHQAPRSSIVCRERIALSVPDNTGQRGRVNGRKAFSWVRRRSRKWPTLGLFKQFSSQKVAALIASLQSDATAILFSEVLNPSRRSPAAQWKQGSAGAQAELA